MKMFIRPMMIVLIIGFGLSSPGQINRAERLMNRFDYHKAVRVLQKAISSNDSVVQEKATKLLATCYRMQNDIPNSREWYGKIVRSGKADTLDYYYYGQALRSSGDYARAWEMFLKYAALNPNDPRGLIYAAYCDSVKAWQSQDPGYEIKNISSLNSVQAEFGPVKYENGILFASDRVNRKGKGKYQWTGNSYVGLFFAEQKNKEKNLEFSTPVLFKRLFNKEYHSGPATFDSAFTLAFITQTNLKKSNEKLWHNRYWIHHLKIYTSMLERNRFRTFRSFFLNSDLYSVGHPALSPDGQTLFFISDMPGGFGGTDVWYCRMNEGKWDTATNAGPVINTPGNEMFPSVALNGDLFYASSGLPGFGGLDIFRASKEGTSWRRPENLGMPVNSSYDDFSVLYNQEDSSGLFSSARPGGSGSDDIYFMKMMPVKVFLIACIRDRVTGAPLPGSMITISNSSSKEVMSYTADVDGCIKMLIAKGVTYSLRAEHEGYLPGLLYVSYESDAEALDFNTPRIIALDPVPVVPPLPPPPPPPPIADIYYDFDKSDIRADAKPVLDNLIQIMSTNNFSIEISAFTDSRGSDSYNMALSQRRAESVINYLVSHGIDRNRIVAAGYGENRLVNKCADNVPCTREEHQANRRAEFKLLPPPALAAM